MKCGLRGRFTGKLMRVKNWEEKTKDRRFIRKIERGSSIKYRPELDGIRAIAVICVVLNHTQFLSWGYYRKTKCAVVGNRESNRRCL